MADPQDDAAALSDIAELAKELGAAGKDAAKASKAADDILARIGELDEDAQLRLMSKPLLKKLLTRVLETEHPQNHDAPPGTISYKTMPGGDKAPWDKKPWTWADLYNPKPPHQPMPLKTWMPGKTIPIGWQGLMVTVQARKQTTLPEVFFGIYMDHYHNVELSEQHAAFLMKKGPLPADPSILTVSGAQSRAVANHDGRVNIHVPGGGIIADWDPAMMKEGA